jgi:hypothetical protein
LLLREIANKEHPTIPMNRRRFLSTAALTATGSLPGRLSAQETAAADLSKYSEAFVPARAITKGPAFHWFAYYDKLQFDPTNRFVLGSPSSTAPRRRTTGSRSA